MYILPFSHLSIRLPFIHASDEVELWCEDNKWCMISAVFDKKSSLTPCTFGMHCNIFAYKQGITSDEILNSKIFWNKHFGETVAQQEVTVHQLHPDNFSVITTDNNFQHQMYQQRLVWQSVVTEISQKTAWMQRQTSISMCGHAFSDCSTVKSCVVMRRVKDSCQPRPVLWIATCLSLLSLSNL